MWRSSLAAGVVAVSLAAPSGAEAQYIDEGAMVAIGAAMYIGGSSALFLETMLIIKTVQGHSRGDGLSLGWAIGELVWGVALTTAGAVIIGVGINNSDDAMMAASVVPGAIGLYHIIHGIVSLATGKTPEDDDATALDLTVLPGGGVLTLSGVWP